MQILLLFKCKSECISLSSIIYKIYNSRDYFALKNKSFFQNIIGLNYYYLSPLRNQNNICNAQIVAVN